jgi:hypothetical protein
MGVSKGLGREACVTFLLAKYPTDQVEAYMKLAEERATEAYWDKLRSSAELYLDMELYLAALNIHDKESEDDNE